MQIWSLDDRAYVDSLFGHQADVVALDAGRAERLLSCGQDHTCRVWKIPEESQLIFRRAEYCRGRAGQRGAQRCGMEQE